jgi:hypothetical protein
MHVTRWGVHTCTKYYILKRYFCSKNLEIPILKEITGSETKGMEEKIKRQCASHKALKRQQNTIVDVKGGTVENSDFRDPRTASSLKEWRVVRFRCSANQVVSWRKERENVQNVQLRSAKRLG